MHRPLFAGASPWARAVRSPRTALLAVAALAASLGLAALPAGAAPPAPPAAEASPAAQVQAQAQVLTWTAGDDFTAYASRPTTAVAGPTTIVFENSAATGNTTGMQHTLTFSTSDPAYNRDVYVDILADPYDSNGGRHQVDVVLTPGKYKFFCAIPGHGSMQGELIVTGGSADTTPPTVTASVSGNRNGDGAYVGSATVTLAASDSGSGVDKTEYSLDGGPFGIYSGPVTVTAPGQHTVSYRATDKAGNTSAAQSVSFTVVAPPAQDSTPPTASASVTGDRDANGAYVGAATVTLSATDTQSGVDRIEYSLNGAAFAAYSAPVTVNQPGQHTVAYRATDKAGNTSAPQSVSFTVVAPPAQDTTPPTASASVTGNRDANGAYVGSATVTLSATDEGSGVDRIEYSLDGAAFAHYHAPLTVNQAGQHTVAYRAIDKAGNTSAAQSVSFTVVAPPAQDSTPPTASASVTGDRDANGAYVGAATVTLSATDTQSGVDRIEYSLDGAAFTHYHSPLTVNQAGQHTVAYRATDKAGNTSAPQSVSFTVVAPPAQDTTPPTASASVSGNRDDSGAYVGSATVTLSATDTQSGVDRIEYSLNGAAYAAYSAPVTLNQPGQYTVSYRATDKAGNTSAPQSVSVRVVAPPSNDTTPPTATATVSGQRNDDGHYVGSATVTVSASDAGSGVARVEYAVDGGPFVAYSGPVTVNSPGAHTVSYRATDRAGNTSTVGSVTFEVVASAPGTTCPVVDSRATVVVGTVDSGVRNRPVRLECTINNLIKDEREWATHDKFVTHVETVTGQLYWNGKITYAEKAAIVKAAKQSGVGKPVGRDGYEKILSNRESFSQWRQAGAGGFTFKDGAISSKAEPGLGMLWYPVREYRNFSLKLQWRDDAPGEGRANSGVFVRFPRVDNHPDESRPEWVAIKYGHELQIFDRTDGDQYKSGSVYGFDRVDLADAHVTPKGTWNDYEIRVVDQHYQIYRNGELINEYVNAPGAVFSPPRADDPGTAGRQNPSGFIGLQNHGAGDLISFRNIRVAELPS
ncbi:Ig-like domain (group 3) [Micromonospora pattaloongensis]|uniref:Ig-like domain (Group 3) n=1 Tax=Micromonospora pattaloongensis TaxID=405436 RepID=A0A1H3NLF5_9ACTN|nr:family 16 glycoside hydrolase [Micromonospora pattaloongensis]SDY89583.1 Ig-like domain (group 3) [Micromonospora pattaloongensis]